MSLNVCFSAYQIPNVKIKFINYFAWHTSTNHLGESYTLFYDCTDDQT